MDRTGLDSMLRRRVPQHRLVLAAAVVAAATTAALIAAFAFPSSHSAIVRKAVPPAFGPLADASSALGAPVVLPDTALVRPSDAANTVESVCVPKNDTVEPPWCQVTVSFPSQGLTVEYARPAPSDALASYKNLLGENDTAKIVDMNGLPALFVPQAQESWLEFAVGGTEITVRGTYGEAALQAVAQSIVDRSPASTDLRRGVNLDPMNFPQWKSKPISLDEASRALGAAVVLPDASLVNPASVKKIWAEGKCPHRSPRFGHPSTACLILILFRSLTLIYERPAGWPHSRAGYARLAKHMPGGAVIDLGGVPAMASTGARSIYFNLSGTRVVVWGRPGQRMPQAIARSIVDRSR
ncbi:MAG TPA: hypothetical protein VMU72_07485 [Gaiellaceae bacterium]|nr:hypothetical protein [Gaiellaceae bacterium]